MFQEFKDYSVHLKKVLPKKRFTLEIFFIKKSVKSCNIKNKY